MTNTDAAPTIRTQTRRISVRASTREEAQDRAVAQATVDYPDRDGIAGPWRAGKAKHMTKPAGFEALFVRADLSDLYVVEITRVINR